MLDSILGEKTLPLELTNILLYFDTLLSVEVVRHVSVMSVLCSISAIKVLPRTIKNILLYRY